VGDSAYGSEWLAMGIKNWIDQGNVDMQDDWSCW